MVSDSKENNFIDRIKQASYSDLDLFAVELREFLIDNVSKTGGHLAANLGVVELTIAIHKAFDTPRDKVIFDVGHQSYVHKIITGRMDSFDSLRQLDGLSGFPKRSESVHDMFDSGHSSTSISAAYGYACARDLNHDNYHCVAVIGDGALSGGVAYEALNNVGASKTPLIVILNDNQMSIDESIGGISEYLHDLRISGKYLNFKKNIKGIVGEQTPVYKFLRNTRDLVKNAVINSGIFEELGFKYFGPIDGHNIKEMVDTFETAKSLNRPVLIHVITKKGKGFIPAEKNPSKFHGIGSFDPSLVTSESENSGDTYSEIFGKKLLQLAKRDNKICAVSAAMIGATGLDYLQSEFPNRVFDAGIAEQHAVSFAAGLALNGMKPVVAIYSTFLQRAYDQIVTDIALQNLPVVFAIDRAGVTGRDGETHQGVFDISFLNALPNMTILSPKDGAELEEMLEYALSLNAPCAIRYPRGKNFDLSSYSYNSNINLPEIVIDDGQYAILALGSMVKESIDAAQILSKNNLDVSVVNMRCVKPLNHEFLDCLKYRFKKIITVEDACLSGGMGESIALYLSQKDDNPAIKCLAWPDKFIEHGGVDELRERYGINASGIASSCAEFFK